MRFQLVWVGRRVYFGMQRKPWGTMAERAPAPVRFCIPLLDSLDDLQAAALANPGTSAVASVPRRSINSWPPSPTLFELAAAGKLTVAVEPIPLAQVEFAWIRTEKGRRIVFTNE